jgi:hypothetical protein
MRRCLFGLLVGLVGYSILAVLHFPAKASGNCMPIADHVAAIQASPVVVGLMPLPGDKLQRAVAFVQKMNGDTAKYDTGYIAWNATHVVLFVGSDGNVCYAFAGSIKFLPSLIEAIEGRAA